MEYDNERYYLGIWKDVLHTFLGMMKAVSNPDDILFNRPPQYWITGLLIPKLLKSRLAGAELVALKDRIFHAFEDENDYEFLNGTDWHPYKDKVERILAGYGEHLPVESKEAMP